MKYPVFACSVVVALFLFLSGTATATDLNRGALAKLEKNVREFTLDNGLRVIMYRRGIAPVFAGAVTVRVGGVDEQVGSTGISHMLEHMAFKGTTTIGTSDFSKERRLLDEFESIMQESSNAPTEKQKQRLRELRTELERYWVTAEFSREYSKRGASGFNATTGKELTKYFVNFPRTALEFWCWIESERILDPVFRQFYKEREVVKEERRMRYSDSPVGELYENLLGVAFLSHPYRNPVIGYEFDLDRLNVTETLAFMKRYYVPGNIVVGIVGDVDPEKDIEIVKKYFGRLKPTPVPDSPSIIESAQKGERRFVIKRKASPELMIGYRKPIYPHEDDARIGVALEILAGGKTSPLYRELVERRRLVSDIGYSEAPGNLYPNLALIMASARAPHSNKQVLQAIDRVIVSLQRSGPSKSQLETAKRSLAMEYLSDLRSNSALARNLGSSELLYGDWRSVVDWFDQIMKVDAKDVQRVMKQYFQPKSRTVGMIERG